MKTRTILLCAALLWGAGSHAQQHRIWFDKPNSSDTEAGFYKKQKPNYNGKKAPKAPDEWEERSLPIGNSALGANVMGSVARERLTLNEKSLWQGGPNTPGGPAIYWNLNKKSAYVLPELRQALWQGEWEKAEKMTEEHFTGLPDPPVNGKIEWRLGSYTTMGEMLVETGIGDNDVTQYVRELLLDSAVAHVRFVHDGHRYRRSYFVSYPDNVLVMRFAADTPQDLTYRYVPNPESKGQVVREGDTWLWEGKLDNNQMKLVMGVKVLANDGTATFTDDGGIRFEKARNLVVLLTAKTDYFLNENPDFNDPLTYVGEDPKPLVLETLRKAAAMDYATLLRRHVGDYQSLYNRMTLVVNPYKDDPALDKLTTPARLKRYKEGQADYDLEMAYFQFGRYLLIASSRPGSLPANLQGVWSNRVRGPWNVDYHNNINVQMNYWPATSTNLDECDLPFYDYIRMLVKPGERMAQDYYGARGWTTSTSSNPFGLVSPKESTAMAWNLAPMSGPWLATHIWDHYDYTHDLAFLKKNYEALKGSALFVCDYLWKTPDGYYTAAPSTSPEHGNVDLGATFSHGVAREVLMDAIAAAKVLKVDKKERKEWQEVLDHIAPYKIGRYGQLMEWSRDIDDPNDHHRHVNHLYGLHPGRTISVEQTPELAQACKVVLEHRGDESTGWSMGWKLNQWARLHDGNHAYTLLQTLLRKGTLDNLWDTHPPFQIDGNFGGTAGYAEMLLQSQSGTLELLPALPDAWEEGIATGLKARGNIEVDLKWQHHKLTEFTLKAHENGTVRVKYNTQVWNIKVRKGQTYTTRL